MIKEISDIFIIKRSESADKFIFEVEISDKLSRSRHIVFLNKIDYEKLKGKDDNPEILIKKVFEFLLQREPKDAILHEFNISQMSNYFPEFESEILSR